MRLNKLKVKKVSLVVLILLIFLVGSIGTFGMHKKGESKGSSTADASGETIELNDGFRVEREYISNFVAKTQCTTSKLNNCWSVSEGKLQYRFSGKTISGSKLDEIDGFWYENDKSGVDEHGNLYDKDGNLYSDNGLVMISSDKVPEDINGKVTRLGKDNFIPVIPLKDDKYLVGEVEVDKETYRELPSGVDLKVSKYPDGGSGIAWVIGDEYYSISQKKEAGIQKTIKSFAGEQEDIWTTSDGKSYSSKDGWDVVGGKLTDGDVFIEVKSEDGVETTIRTEGDHKTETSVYGKDTESKEDDRTETKEYDKDDKLTDYYGTWEKGEFEAEIDSGGNIEYVEYHDEKGNLAKVGFDSSGDGKLDEEDVYYTFKEDDKKTGEIKVCEGKLCLTEEDAKGNAAIALGRKYRETPSSWSKYMGAFMRAAGAFRAYPAISNLLGINDVWFFKEADQFFAKLIGKKLFSSAICEEYHDVTPEGAAFIETPSGTYQAVASIQGERSPTTFPAICDEESPCPKKYSCEEGFCYKDEEILHVYIYKITWGVTAPRDEEFTPNKDEYGNAVNFNIKVGDNWLYEREGVKRGAIELKNGESDSDFRVYYALPSANIDKACIMWGDKAPETTTIGGTEKLPDVCHTIVDSKLGTVPWKDLDPEDSRGSSRVSTGEVQPVGEYLE